MRALSVLTLCLIPSMSCQPLPPPGAEEGQPGAAGERGPAGRDGKDAVVAGSRLRPVWLVGADGSRASTPVFYDAQRREQCQMAAAPDGGYVCAPVGTQITAKNAADYVAFSLQW